MFIRASTALFSVVALAGIASALPSALKVRSSSSECNTGPIQCCNSVQSVSVLSFDAGDLKTLTRAISRTVQQRDHWRALRVPRAPLARRWHPGWVYVLPDHRRWDRLWQFLHLSGCLLQR